MLEQKKSQDSCTLDEKSEDHITVLTRHDSLSSLSVDSLGSNEGEQALFEQCIKSGMPKARLTRKWDDIHSKTLDKNFKARSADRNGSDLPKSHTRNHKSLERNKDDRKSKQTKRDPEFDSLVAAGAFKNCIQKFSKTEEDIMDRALLEEAIYCGMPKRKDKVEAPYKNSPYQANVYYQGSYEERQPSGHMSRKDSLNADSSKNVQVTSVAAASRASCSATNTGVPQAASDVKIAVEVGSTAGRAGGLTTAPLSITKHQRITLPKMEPGPPGRKPSFTGETCKVSPFNHTMNDGSEQADQVDGNGLAKPANDISCSFNDSIFDRSNECRALDSTNYLNDTPESDENNRSNESCANALNQSQHSVCSNLFSESSEEVLINGMASITLDSSLMLASSKTLVQSTTLCSSYKYVNHDVEITLLDSITEKNTNSFGKVEKDSEKQSSTDTWNENTCPNDISFPTISGSVPMLASFKSDLGDEITCGALPDLLEESVVISDGPSRPDLTNQLNNEYIDLSPTNENSTNQAFEFINGTQNHIEVPIHKSSPLTMLTNESKFSTMTNSVTIEHEAQMLSRAIRESSYDYSCLTESGHSLHSLDLDNVKPPSHMGSLLSLTHSMSGNWDDNLERDRLHTSLTKRNINKIHRKKSLPVGLMIKRALGYSHSNQGSSENLDCAVSNLENIKPPSEMDDIFDMENSMISVASIVSEVADTGDDDSSTIIFDFKQPINGMHLMGHIPPHLDIENINPPSLFDELTESTLENDDDDDENCLTHTLAYCPDIPSGSESGTPIASDFGSSAESTPKKTKSGNKKYLTPKQKRQLARDRYKTYTIAAEMAIKEAEEETRKKVPETHTFLESHTPAESSPTPTSAESRDKRSRSNPKQRRQEDRARYQTQTVNISSLTGQSTNTPLQTDNTPKSTVKDPEIEELKRRLEAKKSMKQKRLDNADRYRTRTLDETVAAALESSSLESSDTSRRSSIPKPTCFSPQLNGSDYSQAQLTVEASDFVYHHQPTGEESLILDLDCETISLVSIEDDSELNSLRMKTFTKSFRNYLPVIESPTAVDKCIEKNLKNMKQSANQISPFHYVHKSKDVSELQACNGDLNSIECDQNSGTESADQNQYSDTEVEVPQVKGKPKICKPERDQSVDSNESVEIEESTPKTIRGRRKALYVSPYKRNSSVPRKSPARTTLTGKSTKGFITSKVTNGVTSKVQGSVKAPSSILAKVSHMSVKSTVSAINRSNTMAKNKGVTPPKNKSTIVTKEAISPKAPLVRQGTFTKEEGSLPSPSSAASVTPEKKVTPNSKLTKPVTILKAVVNTSPSRLPQPPVKATFKPPLKKTMSNDPTVAKPANGRTSSNLVPKTSPILKSSSSNQSLQSNDSGKTITLTSKTVKSSSSSSSVNSTVAVPLTKPHTKDVTSKIANLWKKIEQSKKTSTKPDTRVWITNGSSSSTSQDTEESEPVVTPCVVPTKGKLIRSSTFEGSPKAESSIPPPAKQKSSIAIRVSPSPNLKYNSKVPIVRMGADRSSIVGIVNTAPKRGKP